MSDSIPQTPSPALGGDSDASQQEASLPSVAEILISMASSQHTPHPDAALSVPPLPRPTVSLLSPPHTGTVRGVKRPRLWTDAPRVRPTLPAVLPPPMCLDTDHGAVPTPVSVLPVVWSDASGGAAGNRGCQLPRPALARPLDALAVMKAASSASPPSGGAETAGPTNHADTIAREMYFHMNTKRCQHPHRGMSTVTGKTTAGALYTALSDVHQRLCGSDKFLFVELRGVSVGTETDQRRRGILAGACARRWIGTIVPGIPDIVPLAIASHSKVIGRAMPSILGVFKYVHIGHRDCWVEVFSFDNPCITSPAPAPATAAAPVSW